MKRVMIAAALTMMALSGVAGAGDRKDREEDRREAWKEYREAQRELHKERLEARREYEKERREAEREYRKELAEAEREYHEERREAWKELQEDRWARGERIPREYLRGGYYVRDYDDYELSPPPRGYAWVRPDPRDETYYLVQLASGLISRILGQ